jgi:glycosyltransferase involved in cell wall biosynthesis
MFVRNGIRAGYTFMEAIENVLPFADEFFILEGGSDDGTLEALESLARLNRKIRIESKIPAYINAPKDEKGLLLGAAFEEARQKCEGDWLVQVQADTVFHPITVLAARYFLERRKNALKYDAIEVLRYQYRWNWQDMYRQDRLALIFKKDAGLVAGDAINVAVNGRISRSLSPLFKRFPAADNAWSFFENIPGKITGASEIWGLPKDSAAGDFTWYNEATGRNFKEDIDACRKSGILPPLWLEKSSPFIDILPSNLSPHIGANKYTVASRFMEKGGAFDPILGDILKMLAEAEARSGLFPFFSRLWQE